MAKLFANDTIRPSVITKSYSAQLQKEHDGSKWGSTGERYSGAAVLHELRNRPYVQTVLDYGAGKGSLGTFITQALPHIKWTNYDPGMPEYDVLPEKQFDLVVSTDVLEHVEPFNLTSVLSTLESLTGKVLISDIACSPTGKLFSEGPYVGQDLHLIVETPDWWRSRFAEDVGLEELVFEHQDKRSKGKLKTRCFMIHERV